jgi:redox-sensing transcriptional repressor
MSRRIGFDGSIVTYMTGALPPSTVARLPRYLRYLERLEGQTGVVSSEDVAGGSGVTAVQVRKDLSFLGTVGTRGVGYDVGTLRGVIVRALGLEGPLTVIIVGAGNLGTALANYRGFAGRGFEVVAIYDVSPTRVGSEEGGLSIRHLEMLEGDLEATPADIAVISTPAESAQDVADRLVKAGVRSVLNFAPVMVSTPGSVTVRQVDLATELQILSYHLSRSG